MNTTPTPLHTNTSKKVVFIFSVASSMFFNVLLFSSIGTSIYIRLVWSLVGISAVFFQTVKLREYYNTKKRIRFLHLTFYIICTIGSVAGTIGAGYSHIEKTKPSISKVELIKTDNAIDKILNSKQEINQWAGLALLKRKERIEKMKINIKENNNNAINSLSGIAHIFGISEQLTAFIFLIFVSIILELMVFGSATYNGSLFKKKIIMKKKKLSKIGKQKKSGQGFFFKLVA